MMAYLVGEAGISPDCKVTPAEVETESSTLAISSASVSEAVMNLEVAPKAALDTRLALAKPEFSALAGEGFP
jgi:hypothetical protein